MAVLLSKRDVRGAGSFSMRGKREETVDHRQVDAAPQALETAVDGVEDAQGLGVLRLRIAGLAGERVLELLPHGREHAPRVAHEQRLRRQRVTTECGELPANTREV